MEVEPMEVSTHPQQSPMESITEPPTETQIQTQVHTQAPTQSKSKSKVQYYLNTGNSLRNGREYITLIRQGKERERLFLIRERRVDHFKKHGNTQPSQDQINEIFDENEKQILNKTEEQLAIEETRLDELKYISNLQNTIDNGKVPKEYGFARCAKSTVCDCIFCFFLSFLFFCYLTLC